MFMIRSELIGKGLYSLQEATKLTGADYSTIRRWMLGYSYKNRMGNYVVREPIFKSEIGDIDGQFTISFQDLIELLFVSSFRKRGVRWKIIHEAFDIAKERFRSSHPFSSINFKTDGKRIFEEAIVNNKAQLSDLHMNQIVMSTVVEPSLKKGIEFEDGRATVWYPLHPSKSIALDPERSFGRPIIKNRGIPTEVLFAAYEAEENYESVAREFDIQSTDVKQAVDFQRKLAA